MNKVVSLVESSRSTSSICIRGKCSMVVGKAISSDYVMDVNREPLNKVGAQIFPISNPIKNLIMEKVFLSSNGQ